MHQMYRCTQDSNNCEESKQNYLKGYYGNGEVRFRQIA